MIQVETDNDGKPRKVGREIAWSAVIAGAALAFTFYQAANAVYRYLDDRIDTIQLVVNSNDEFKKRQIDEGGRVVGRIERIEDTIVGCREKLVALQARADSCTDPISRAAIRRLQDRMDNVEHRR